MRGRDDDVFVCVYFAFWYEFSEALGGGLIDGLISRYA